MLRAARSGPEKGPDSRMTPSRPAVYHEQASHATLMTAASLALQGNQPGAPPAAERTGWGHVCRSMCFRAFPFLRGRAGDTCADACVFMLSPFSDEGWFRASARLSPRVTSFLPATLPLSQHQNCFVHTLLFYIFHIFVITGF